MRDPFTVFGSSPVVLDGAMASELERRGCDLNDALWSARVLIEQPQLIRDVHYDYFLAGADVATTASYQASFPGFARRGIDAGEAARLMRLSVELAQAARDAFWADEHNRVGRTRPLVAASVGPYGAMLADGSEYRGHYGLSEQQLVDFHRPRIAALLAAGPDLLACETIPCQQEALALARLLRDEFPQAAAWISFSCRDDANLSEGTPLADAIAALQPFAQAVAVGVNCTAPRHIAPLLQAAAQASGKRLLTYPNSGETYDPVSKTWHDSNEPQAFADAARQWRAAGASCIGGCCRTTPDDIRALAAWLRGSRGQGTA
ncbi:homocysteine S-methyltransferase [Vogesella sp. LIG4]|uniref:homocysteine S-methyltransferase n=1 Tax=Vogesella sp. LIG4 TaxID=1192162 RepID=UPI00081FA1DF|nr:homocysteine S-methyltransferase [Vogesella sp. LIG4]SCK22241.1 homocysteine S-methyltransferase [Vogesella sp. LIG4]